MKKVSNPLITVVVPIYKVEQYIDRCIKSIVNQTYSNLEIILVDDGSPDKCPKMCDNWAKKDNRIKVIHKENGGLSDARNAGIDIAKGEYITFIDSDDYIDDDYVEFLYNMIREDKTDLSICSHTVIYETGKIIKKETKVRDILSSEDVLYQILYDCGIDLSAWAKLYSIKLFKNVRYPKGRVFEDAATTYKLIDQCNKISVGSFSKYNYIIRKDSISNNKFSIKKMDLITSTKEMTDYLRKKYPNLDLACNRRLMYAYLSTLTQLAKSNVNDNENKKIMMDYINSNRKKVLKDKKIPKRDRVALNCTKFGYNFFKFSWNFYDRITNRK